MLRCLIFRRHEWGEWFRSGLDNRWVRGCRRCPEIERRDPREAAAATPSLPPDDADALNRLLIRAYMRGHSNGRYNNAPPNPMSAVEELLTEVVFASSEPSKGEVDG
jgi:hypothetical protein